MLMVLPKGGGYFTEPEAVLRKIMRKVETLNKSQKAFTIPSITIPRLRERCKGGGGMFLELVIARAWRRGWWAAAGAMKERTNARDETCRQEESPASHYSTPHNVFCINSHWPNPTGIQPARLHRWYPLYWSASQAQNRAKKVEHGSGSGK